METGADVAEADRSAGGEAVVVDGVGAGDKEAAIVSNGGIVTRLHDLCAKLEKFIFETLKNEIGLNVNERFEQLNFEILGLDFDNVLRKERRRADGFGRHSAFAVVLDIKSDHAGVFVQSAERDHHFLGPNRILAFANHGSSLARPFSVSSERKAGVKEWAGSAACPGKLVEVPSLKVTQDNGAYVESLHVRRFNHVNRTEVERQAKFPEAGIPTSTFGLVRSDQSETYPMPPSSACHLASVLLPFIVSSSSPILTTTTPITGSHSRGRSSTTCRLGERGGEG